jgi:transcriptional regulator with XRE-family HTH domain
LKILADFYGISIDYFFSDSEKIEDFDLEEEHENDIRISIPTTNEKKFREVLLYILEKLSSKPSFTETVLHKILYFSDFDFYELYETPFI